MIFNCNEGESKTSKLIELALNNNHSLTQMNCLHTSFIIYCTYDKPQSQTDH